MWNRNSIGITVVIVLLIIDLLIYKYQNANCVNRILIRCYPTREKYPYKDTGRKMTDGFVSYWENVVNHKPDNPDFSLTKKMVDTPKVVFTKTLDKSTWKNTILAKGNFAEEIANLKNKPIKDIIVYGSAGFVSSLIKEGLIEEYHLFVHPTSDNGMTIF